VVTRVLAEAVGTALGQPLVIENRTGGAAGGPHRETQGHHCGEGAREGS
jgi:tripartite-type tricarboxylate transporter receptor subunit TctC